MLPKSLEQANAPTSEAGGIETQSQGDTCGYKTGVCLVVAFLTRLTLQEKIVSNNKLHHLGITGGHIPPSCLVQVFRLSLQCFNF